MPNIRYTSILPLFLPWVAFVLLILWGEVPHAYAEDEEELPPLGDLVDDPNWSSDMDILPGFEDELPDEVKPKKKAEPLLPDPLLPGGKAKPPEPKVKFKVIERKQGEAIPDDAVPLITKDDVFKIYKGDDNDGAAGGPGRVRKYLVPDHTKPLKPPPVKKKKKKKARPKTPEELRREQEELERQRVEARAKLDYRLEVLAPALYDMHKEKHNTHLPSPVYEEDYRKLIFMAVSRGDIDALRSLFDRVDEHFVTDRHGNTLLLRAVIHGQLDVARLLVGRGHDVNGQNKNHVAPLHVAVYRGDKEHVSLLMDHGADVNILDKAENTPLNYAVELGKSNLIPLLFSDHHGDVVQATLDRALFNAILKDEKSLIKELIRKGADVNYVREKDGMTSLMIAAKKGQRSLVSLLLKHGADVLMKNKEGRTASQEALINRHFAIGERLALEELELQKK